jgi:hypothetical protein
MSLQSDATPIFASAVGESAGGVVPSLVTQTVGASGVAPVFTGAGPIETSAGGVAPVFTGMSNNFMPNCPTSLNNPSTGSSDSVGYSPSDGDHSKSNVNAGAIAGGVVGGLAVVAIAVVLLYWIRRRYPRLRHVETEAMPAPPHYGMSSSSMSGVAQPAHVSTGEQPAYVYQSEGLGAKEDMSPVHNEKHVEVWPVDKKI